MKILKRLLAIIIIGLSPILYVIYAPFGVILFGPDDMNKKLMPFIYWVNEGVDGD